MFKKLVNILVVASVGLAPAAWAKPAASSAGAAFRLTTLKSGRIRVEACRLTSKQELRCQGLGNPAGYVAEDFADLTGAGNQVGAVALGAAEVAIIVASLGFGLVTAATLGSAEAGAAAWASYAYLAGFGLLPAGVVVLVGKTVDAVNPFRQWKKGRLKNTVERSVSGLDEEGEVVLIPVETKKFQKSVDIMTEVLKKLPSHDTWQS